MGDIFDEAGRNLERSEENLKRNFEGMKTTGMFFKKIFSKIYNLVKDKVEEKRNEKIIRKLRPF